MLSFFNFISLKKPKTTPTHPYIYFRFFLFYKLGLTFPIKKRGAKRFCLSRFTLKPTVYNKLCNPSYVLNLTSVINTQSNQYFTIKLMN